MTAHRIEERPAFDVIGKQTWISGQDNGLFGRFWQTCREDGTLDRLAAARGDSPCPQTGAAVFGVSRVDADPANRAFHFVIGIERPEGFSAEDMVSFAVPASTWAVFESLGELPDALVQTEIYAFSQWLPNSGYVHAAAPEIEVYPMEDTRDGVPYCEFWLPIARSD